jgi:hypothetical protein
MITSTSGPKIQMRIEQLGGGGRPAPIPALAQGSTHPRYIQTKCRLQEKGGGLEDWGGQLGSHLPLLPSKLEEEGQTKAAGFVSRSNRACRRELSARDGAAASCLTPRSQTLLLRWTEERRTRGRRLWPKSGRGGGVRGLRVLGLGQPGRDFGHIFGRPQTGPGEPNKPECELQISVLF